MLDLEATSISDYRLLDLVGQGQFAQVYCAIHRRTGQLVAIKQTRHAPESATQEPFILSELSSGASSRASSGAGHPNLVKCHAISQTDAGYQSVLDYCEGGTLRAAIGERLPFLEAKSLIIDILQGLTYIHGHDIIHGDLKPENILLTYGLISSQSASSGHEALGTRLTAKIGDFGSARFAQLPNHSYREIGSPTYAAPERFNGQSSYASDLYSVGVMLYELLLGDRPFSGSPQVLRLAHQTQPIPFPPALKPAARQLLATALHKQPNQRFTSASAMLAALRQLSDLHSFPRAAPTPAAVPTLSVNRALTVIPTPDIAEPITRLIPLPQGYAVVTAKSFHLLTPAAKLLPIAQFENDVWIAVDPQGKWFITVPQQASARNKGLQGKFYPLSETTVGQAKTLSNTCLTTPQAKTVQIMAIDSRYWLRVKTSQASFKTSLECFTRRGQFVGQLSLNFPIVDISVDISVDVSVDVSLAATPYQLIARMTAASSNILLVSLKPFQIRRFPHYSGIQQVSALPWGYIASGSERSLVLDKSAELAGILKDLPFVSAIAPLGNHQLLLAAPAKVNGSLAEPSSASGPSSLFTVNLQNLDLGIIF